MQYFTYKTGKVMESKEGSMHFFSTIITLY
jgi:hypothetical protein